MACLKPELLWLIALREFVPFFYEKEMAVYKSEIEVEVSTDKELSSVDCQSLVDEKLRCMQAQSEYKIHKSYEKSYRNFLNTAWFLFMLFFILSLAFYVFFLSLKTHV